MIFEIVKGQGKIKFYIPKSYPEQFRVQKQNVFNMNSKLQPISTLSQPRVTVVKRPSIRSDTYLLVADKPVKTSVRQLPVIKVPARSTSIPTVKRRVQVIPRNGGSQSLPRYVSTSIVRRDPEHKNIYLTKKRNGVYYSSSASDDLSDRPRRTRLANHEYIVQRRKPAVDYIYDDYRVVSNEITNSYINSFQLFT